LGGCVPGIPGGVDASGQRRSRDQLVWQTVLNRDRPTRVLPSPATVSEVSKRSTVGKVLQLASSWSFVEFVYAKASSATLYFC